MHLAYFLSLSRSGVLQPGDRILAVNGQQLEGMTLEDARSIIKESNNQIHLEIEFDVAGRDRSCLVFASSMLHSSIRFRDALVGHVPSEDPSKESRPRSFCDLYVLVCRYVSCAYPRCPLPFEDSRSSRADEVPLISDVRRGSIAYRCGMIQAGDRLLSIDTHSLRGKSLSDIVSLLKNCDDIVRLKIKKDDSYSEDNLCENVVVYKVQLLRQG